MSLSCFVFDDDRMLIQIFYLLYRKSWCLEYILPSKVSFLLLSHTGFVDQSTCFSISTSLLSLSISAWDTSEEKGTQTVNAIVLVELGGDHNSFFCFVL